MTKDELMVEVGPYSGNDEVIIAIDVNGIVRYYTVESVDSKFASEDICTLCAGEMLLL